MTAINKQLVLIGGRKDNRGIKKLSVWTADQKKWINPYPDMNTARLSCSAGVHAEWLIVAGGFYCDNHGGGHCLDSVEALNTDTNQWYIGPPMPVPSQQMNTAIAGGVFYCMGGYANSLTTDMYSIPIEALMLHINSEDPPTKDADWKVITGLNLAMSTSLSMRGSLLRIGGWDTKNHKAATAIHLYQPDTGDWMKVGDLPTPRYSCTCALISDREIFVAGGTAMKRVDICDGLLEPVYLNALHPKLLKLNSGKKQQ